MPRTIPRRAVDPHEVFAYVVALQDADNDYSVATTIRKAGDRFSLSVHQVRRIIDQGIAGDWLEQFDQSQQLNQSPWRWSKSSLGLYPYRT